MSTLAAVLSQIKSERVKERQEGLTSLRHLFERDSAVLNLDEIGDGRAWLVVFQALFTAVANEKAAYTKKGASKKTAGTSTAALRRLSEAASVVRWLTERSVQRMNRKVCKALLSHLLQSISYHGELFTPLALDYVKALRCIIAFTPHLDHMDEEVWIDMVQLSFNVVLGDPIRAALRDEIDEDDDFSSPTPVLEDADSPDHDTDAASITTQPRKRRRVESAPVPRHTPAPTPVQSSHTVTLEQIEFTSLLASLLQSGSAPLLSPEYSYLPGAILSRLRKFAQIHSLDTSLHQDYLVALSAALSHLALNEKVLVSKFAWDTWDTLLGIWKSRVRSVKEELVAILRVLFPFISSSQSGPEPGESAHVSSHMHSDGLGKLWNLLDAEAESRWSIDALSLDTLRLQIESEDEYGYGSCRKAFVARTFKSCWHFDAGQALAWAVLELQADCAEKLYLLSESTLSGITASKSEGKRIRRDNPITSILTDIRTQTEINIRICRLQTLLFVIDRHWSVFHDDLRLTVITTLSQFLSSDDATIQSWVFMCLAAIAHTEGSLSNVHLFSSLQSPHPQTCGVTIWEPVWTHAMRRACVPNVCRAASHAAHVLLMHSKCLLTPQRVLVEIESFTKDLDVQGPAFPYDSVSMFLVLCLKVASQDVRLYRMQLEEKALAWIMDSWKIAESQPVGESSQDRRTKLRLPAHTINDVMLLLESICGISKHTDVICQRVLPDCRIADAVSEEHRTAVIRDFLLHAKVPPFRPGTNASRSLGSNASRRSSEFLRNDRDLVQPRGRERKISAYLLKFLDSLVEKWETFKEGHSTSTGEQARRCLDVAVVGLCFESSLHLNGTRPNRRVVQASCRLIALISPLFAGNKWTPDERMLMLLGLEPLIRVGDDVEPDQNWNELLLPPDEGTGIKRKILSSLELHKERRVKEVQSLRREVQRVIFRSADVQDAFSNVLKTLKLIVRTIAGVPDNDPQSSTDLGTGDGDGFAPIRTYQVVSQAGEVKQQHDVALRYSVRICIDFLVLVPILQSASGEPTRDNQLADIITNSDAETFQLLAPCYFDNVRDRFLSLSISGLGRLLNKLGDLFRQYSYSRCEQLQLVAISCLDSTSHIWVEQSAIIGSVGQHVRDLCQWFSNILIKNKIRTWRVRFKFACFMDRYLDRDPLQQVWSLPIEGDESEIILATTMLPGLGADEDIRVRLKMAMINARFLSPMRLEGEDAIARYALFKEPLCTDAANYEHMLTRLVYMANVMVVSSPMRRGAYWHVLELSVYSSVYTTHIESVLRSVAHRMGLPNYPSLFESYASQIAYSLRRAGYDFSRFPPHLLGYSSRREYAEAAFHAFSPTNLLAEDPDIARGQQHFASHCKAIQMTIAEGLSKCFADVVGHQILIWTDSHLQNPDDSFSELEIDLKARMQGLKEGFDEQLQRNVDSIVMAILRGLGDQDFRPEGDIVQTLRATSQSEETIRTFQAISHHRSMDDFQVHEPNLPSFSTVTVLRALQWFHQRVPETDSPATSFHVLHRIFAEIMRSPIVNEQLRLINALTVWIASHHSHFRDTTLLHTLVQWCTVSMSQCDLVRAGQSMIEWAFSSYIKLKYAEPRLPDVLISLCCLAHDFATDTGDAIMAKLGSDILRWIESQALQLCKRSAIRELVMNALPAWPTDPSPELASLLDNMSSAKLSTILADQRVSPNKFRLARRLHHFISAQDKSGDQFGRSDFWHLKNCIPPMEQLQEDDIDAFSALLVRQQGSINGFGIQQARAPAILTPGPYRKPFDNAVPSPQRRIITSLLGLLDVNDASQLHVAYTTLRLIMSVLPTDADDPFFPCSPERKELEFLRTYPFTPCQRPNRNFHELQQSSYIDVAGDFAKWITTVSTLLSDTLAGQDPLYAQLASILQADSVFAEQTLPILVHSVLQMDLSRQSANEHDSYSKVLSQYFTSILSSESADTACIKSIIDVVLHLRRCKPPSTIDPSAHDKWLILDYLLLSRNAISCGAYTTALLFLELSAEHSDSLEDETAKAEQILFDIYSHIDEPDGFYGIRTRDLRNFLVKRFHHERQWDKAFRFHGAALEAGDNNPTEAEGVLQSLHSFGFHNLAIKALQNSTGPKLDPHSSEMSYHLGWRTETWDLPSKAEEPHFGAPLYLALRAIYRERDPECIDVVVRHSLYDQMSQLRVLGDENLAEIRQVAQNLMCLNQIRQWRTQAVQQNLASKQSDLGQWCNEVSQDIDFTSFEALMATRISLIRSVREKEERDQLGNLVSPFVQNLVDLEKKCLLTLSEAAREACNLQVSLNSIVRAQKLELQASSMVSQEFANVLWLHKEQKLAVQFLKDLVISSKHGIDALGLKEKLNNAVLLARLGTWTAEACLEKPTDILVHYFNPAVGSLSKVGRDALDREHATIFHQCAMFAEQQYHTIVRSPDAIRWKLYVDRKTQEIEQRKDQIMKTQPGSKEYGSLSHEQKKAEALLRQDLELVQQHNHATNSFLEQAIDMYSRGLEANDAFDDDGPIRMCSLWFANFENTVLQPKVRSALERVPSRKFIFLAHQLSARLTTSPTSNISHHQRNLQSLVERMCREHPFHSLYQVYCLRAERATVNLRRRHSSRNEQSSSQERAAAAGEVFDKLRNDTIVGRIVQDVERVCDACLEWAKHPIKRHHAQKPKPPHHVPENLLIRNLKQVKVPVLTSHTPLDPTLKYEDCTWIDRFENTYDIAGGVNLPKIIYCIGSDGNKYKQLFKGEGADDMRQDAVMEQVFELVNVVLRRDRETKRRNLSVRGYRVIPLATQAGILEFVENTSPLNSWLQEAHRKYRPGDLKPSDVATMFRKKREETGGQEELMVEMLSEIRQRFKPVMRHYFTERHKSPMSWFEIRLNYARSVATTSIVGHILGLGDRHTSNILLDNGSGEVVHIDLGIAFDQGKLLPVPERVPFRLTPDIVDGLGISGTQGVYQRCAEETLRVLRDGSEVIRTVLEVFKHDPLHSWTASEIKIKRVQGTAGGGMQDTAQLTNVPLRFGIGIDMASGTADEAADRALSSVTRKLDRSLSVEYTVNQLIAEATDLANLAMMYFGWSPHL